MIKQVSEALDLLDSPNVNGAAVVARIQAAGPVEASWRTIVGERGSTDFVRFFFPGTSGKSGGGSSPTLGIIGRLGGIGARPQVIGLVSDGDGAVTAVACALKLAAMAAAGDRLPGDVIITTHICPDAPTEPHEPVPFMGSPVDMRTMNAHEVDPAMDAILTVDTTRGNRIINRRGFAISPTVKEGYILRVSEDLLTIMQIVTGRAPAVFAVTMQDITPYGNGVYHLNSILQPATATAAPVVGVALTTETAVPGSASGASQFADIEAAARFCLEVAKAYGAGRCSFYDPEEYRRLLSLYGPLRHFQTPGRSDNG